MSALETLRENIIKARRDGATTLVYTVEGAAQLMNEIDRELNRLEQSRLSSNAKYWRMRGALYVARWRLESMTKELSKDIPDL